MTTDIGADALGAVLARAGVWALVGARVSGFCLTAPALAIPELDWRFRLGLMAALGIVLVPVIEPMIVPPADWSSAALTLTLETLIGCVLGWSAALIVAAARQGGELVAAHAGLSTATLFDPETGEEQTPLGRLFGWIALAVFLRLTVPWCSSAHWRKATTPFPWAACWPRRDVGAGLRSGGPCPCSGAQRRRAPRYGPHRRQHRSGLAEPRCALAAVCCAHAASSYCAWPRGRRTWPGHTSDDRFVRLGHSILLAMT